jgi:hypothetical protein
MFFWGGEATRACAQSAQSLNLMGVWRDSVRSQCHEETGASRAMEQEILKRS